MTTRLLDHDPISGITTTFRYDSATDKFKIGYSQSKAQVEAIIDSNKRQMAECDPKAQMKNDMIWYCRVPTIVQYEWLAKYGLNFNRRDHFKACMDMVEHGDYRYLKTCPIKHEFKSA